MPRLPKRGATHRLEERSERYFRMRLPNDWVCEKQQYDYGVDLRVEIFEDDEATGLELLVQLKASNESSAQETEIVRLKTSTYNYLRDKLQVVMLVKFVAEDNAAFYLLLRDIPEPGQGRKTFSVRIPKCNRLSDIDWDAIRELVRNVTCVKLGAARRWRRAEGADV